MNRIYTETPEQELERLKGVVAERCGVYMIGYNAGQSDFRQGIKPAKPDGEFIKLGYEQGWADAKALDGYNKSIHNGVTQQGGNPSCTNSSSQPSSQSVLSPASP